MPGLRGGRFGWPGAERAGSVDCVRCGEFDIDGEYAYHGLNSPKGSDLALSCALRTLNDLGGRARQRITLPNRVTEEAPAELVREYPLPKWGIGQHDALLQRVAEGNAADGRVDGWSRGGRIDGAPASGFGQLDDFVTRLELSLRAMGHDRKSPGAAPR